MHRPPRSVLLSLAALALAACTQAAPPAVSAVDVTGEPAGNTIRIGTETQLGAAVTAGGATVGGRAIAWASSDERVASVSADGTVVAHRFGTVTITATSGGVAGRSSALTTYGLEAVGGTLATDPSAPGVPTGSFFSHRFREADLTGLLGTLSWRVEGPPGWNGDAPFELLDQPASNDTSLNFWVSAAGPERAALAGTYRITLTAAGETYTTSVAIDATQTLGGTIPTLTGASANEVSGAWAPVAGAASYRVVLLERADGRVVADRYTFGTSATFTNLTLDPAKSYRLQVWAFSFTPLGPTAFAATFPEQANASIRGVNLAVLSAWSLRSQATLCSTQDTRIDFAYESGSGVAAVTSLDVAVLEFDDPNPEDNQASDKGSVPANVLTQSQPGSGPTPGAYTIRGYYRADTDGVAGYTGARLALHPLAIIVTPPDRVLWVRPRNGTAVGEWTRAGNVITPSSDGATCDPQVSVP